MIRRFLPLVLLGLAACQPRGSSASDPGASPALQVPRSADGKAAGAPARVGTNPGHAGRGTPLAPAPGHALAAFAQGCFWGAENTYRQVAGVTATAVGYTGGHSANPTYEAVCSHGTGHAEAVLVEFDPRKVSYEELLEVFWASHDPTTKNRQGPDVGDQYRSAVFTFDAEQERAALASKAAQTDEFNRPITTEIAAIGRFYLAEGYHQQYDEKTGTESCPLPVRAQRTSAY